MSETEREIEAFLEEHEAAYRPLYVAAHRAAWEASTTGDEEAARRAARANAEARKLYADAAAWRRVRGWLESGAAGDPLVRRQLEVLDRKYLPNQLPPETIDELEERAQEIELLFQTFRPEVGGRTLTDNDVRRILETEGDTPLRREAWEASKAVGERVADRLRALARRRNEAARSLGFDDYYLLELAVQELDAGWLDAVVEEAERRTAGPFREAKAGVDASLRERFGAGADAPLRPWHYADPFFQEPPPTGDVELDPLFRDRDVVTLARDYFASVGLPVDEALERSDLFERPGKDQHAFCTDMDREGDVRILCNVRHDARWMGTLLHELGHAVYDLYIPRSLPFLLRAPAHTFATEAVAMFFGALIRDAGWLGTTLGLPAARRTELAGALAASRARELLVFARWALVMVRFERAFYRDPERADLNRLWWELAARFQGLAPPDDVNGRQDWAAKIHLSVAPVYYHNYLLGELFAAQLRDTLAGDASPEGPGLGDFFRRRVFRHGACLPGQELVRAATGAPLSAGAFARTVGG